MYDREHDRKTGNEIGFYPLPLLHLLDRAEVLVHDDEVVDRHELTQGVPDGVEFFLRHLCGQVFPRDVHPIEIVESQGQERQDADAPEGVSDPPLIPRAALGAVRAFGRQIGPAGSAAVRLHTCGRAAYGAVRAFGRQFDSAAGTAHRLVLSGVFSEHMRTLYYTQSNVCRVS